MKNWIMDKVNWVLDNLDPYWTWGNLWKLAIICLVVWFGHGLMH
jgi:hypothetical protein